MARDKLVTIGVIMPDLLVSIPSRDRVNDLGQILEMLFATCKDRHNFDIQIVIDIDQEYLYGDIKNKYTDLKWTFADHDPYGWLNIYEMQHSLFLKEQYYFNWFIADDLTHLSQNWDEAILKCKNTFADNLFCLHSQYTDWGRSMASYKECYARDINVHEHYPIWTRQWGEFLIPLFTKGSKYIVFRELIIAALLRLLHIQYNESRNVSCNINYEAHNQGNSIKFAQYWFELVKRDYDDLKPVAERMKEYIDSATN